MHSRSRFLLWLLLAFTVVPFAGAQVYRITDLGTLPAGTVSSATGINNLGQVSGSADISPGVSRAFLWTANGGMQDLGIFPSDPYNEPYFSSWANQVNDLGCVVGGSWYDSEINHAFIWSHADGMQADADDGVEDGGGDRSAFHDGYAGMQPERAGLRVD